MVPCDHFECVMSRAMKSHSTAALSHMNDLLNGTVFTKREHINTIVLENDVQTNIAVARTIANLIRDKAAKGANCVLGLATGSTPTGVYAELVRLHQEEGLSFQNVITFNLDEYFPMSPDSLQSYVRFMNEHLFDLVDIKRENVHIPDGTINADDVPAYCKQYETQIGEAGGIDLQLLGIGRNGHVGMPRTM